jgi:hypothetical protein
VTGSNSLRLKGVSSRVAVLADSEASNVNNLNLNLRLSRRPNRVAIEATVDRVEAAGDAICNKTLSFR